MKQIIKLYIAAMLPLLITGCTIEPRTEWYNCSYATFLHNSLDKPILVTTYFAPIPPKGGDTVLVESDFKMVRIEPDETKQVMDYSLPLQMVLYNASDSSQLTKSIMSTDEYNKLFKLRPTERYERVDDVRRLKLYYPESRYDRNPYISEEGLRYEKYLSENVDWDYFPIHFDYPIDLGIEAKKYLRSQQFGRHEGNISCYQNCGGDGYGVVRLYTIKTDYDGFLK